MDPDGGQLPHSSHSNIRAVGFTGMWDHRLSGEEAWCHRRPLTFILDHHECCKAHGLRLVEYSVGMLELKYRIADKVAFERQRLKLLIGFIKRL
jgi:hypothetical protein